MLGSPLADARRNSSLRMRAAARCIWIVAALVSLVGCRTGRAEESKALIPLDAGDLRGTGWALAPTDDATRVDVSPTVTLRFDDDRASCTSPCNRYQARFAHSGRDATFGVPVAMSRRTCPPAVVASERRYFHALDAVDHVDIEMHRLVLTGHGDVRLVFTRTIG